MKPNISNIQYGPHERNVFDIWFTRSNQPAPLLIWFHGGGYVTGDKEDHVPFIEHFINNGISIVSANYRFRQHAPFPAQMLDGARVIQYLRYHHNEFNIDPSRIAIGGNSAGGHMACWIAFKGELADISNKDPILRQSTRVSAFCGEDTQPVFDPRELKKLFGRMPENFQLEFFGITKAQEYSPEVNHLYEEASPINHVTHESPPTFLIYSRTNDICTGSLDWMHLIHHPLLGITLKRRMEMHDIECIIRYPEDSETPTYEVNWKEMICFLMIHFGRNFEQDF